MFKAAITRPWICSRCIRRQTLVRWRHTAQALSSAPRELDFGGPLTAGGDAPGAIHDDKTLRKIFDSAKFWKEFSQSSQTGRDGGNVGLFQNRYLTNPQGFMQFANASLEKAKRLVDKVLHASSAAEYHEIVRNLDRLSDLLCRVIDLSDFVRATHPDRAMQVAATNAYSMMFEYMNVLNTTTGLAKQLEIAMSDGNTKWSEQEQMVAEILRNDFAKSASDLPREQRERFVSLSQEISEVGTKFVDSMAPSKQYTTFRSSQLKGMDPMLVKQFTQWGQVKLPTVGEAATMALRSVQDSDVRKEIFMASRTSSQGTVMRLQVLLKKRAELAKLSGYKSYAEMTLQDKMAGGPDMTRTFLEGLNGQNAQDLESQLELLKQEKRRANFLPNDIAELAPWDKEFYMAKAFARSRSNQRNPDFLAAYFSLGTVMQGLSRLFSSLYGVRFVPHETQAGETWNSDVRRLDVVSDTDGHVAVLYCDLFSRPGKSPNPAHFTLRCSRLISGEEVQEAHANQNPLFSSPEEAANDGMAISKTMPNGGVMQLPTIALICDFRTPSDLHRPSLLSFSEVSTLFHEMGHAIHSILGRTDFQNVSGTRCATDLAELPSILMEHFASDPSVLSLFARHYETDEPLPYEMVAEQLAMDKKFNAIDIDNQIILSLLDQECHSAAALDPSFNTTQLYHNLQTKYSKQPTDPPGTSWQGFFGHLFGYGGTYYSYLFDRVLARRVWQMVFMSGREAGSVSRSRGERLKENLLKWGGARDPWRCLSTLLEDERLLKDSNGSANGMKLVGQWGIEGGEAVGHKMSRATDTSRKPISASL
ncbi:Mitochondrial intermediate peptidase [Lachnellula suecica]|uniref:Mitochondrial intermediate peptidase n=1 Tax=Lachnellula suecica TaxID=602035 RepID=A0A8T9BV26_9HELO|nr:Mitochondrial intermediate peptidase [Lachnellula suecica]